MLLIVHALLRAGPAAAARTLAEYRRVCAQGPRKMSNSDIGTDSGRGSGCRRDESRGVTSDLNLRLHAPYVPARGQGTQKPGSQTAASTRSSPITAASMARFAGTDSWRVTGCRRDEDRGVTSDFLRLHAPYVPEKGRGTQKTRVSDRSFDP